MLANWQASFPECEPIAHRMRDAFRSRWVRFHSLPGSKRYPEDEAEYRTVLERFNCVLGELLGSKRRVVLLTTSSSETPNAVPRQPELHVLDPDAAPWGNVPMRAVDGFADPGYWWHVFASEWEWQPGLIDPIVRLVADEVIFNVMVVPPDFRWLLHPYDGGMDVILESREVRNRLQAAHRDWLSPRADGL